jgi:hypothetical protein
MTGNWLRIAKNSDMPGPGRKWIKGQSGNPGGRPKTVGIVQDLARQHTANALEVLLVIMNDPDAPAAARVSAAAQLLDRGHGKPAQRSDVNLTNDIDPNELSDAALAEYIASGSSNSDEGSEDDPSKLN